MTSPTRSSPLARITKSRNYILSPSPLIYKLQQGNEMIPKPINSNEVLDHCGHSKMLKIPRQFRGKIGISPNPGGQTSPQPKKDQFQNMQGNSNFRKNNAKSMLIDKPKHRSVKSEAIKAHMNDDLSLDSRNNTEQMSIESHSTYPDSEGPIYEPRTWEVLIGNHINYLVQQILDQDTQINHLFLKTLGGGEIFDRNQKYPASRTPKQQIRHLQPLRQNANLDMNTPSTLLQMQATETPKLPKEWNSGETSIRQSIAQTNGDRTNHVYNFFVERLAERSNLIQEHSLTITELIKHLYKKFEVECCHCIRASHPIRVNRTQNNIESLQWDMNQSMMSKHRPLISSPNFDGRANGPALNKFSFGNIRFDSPEPFSVMQQYDLQENYPINHKNRNLQQNSQQRQQVGMSVSPCLRCQEQENANRELIQQCNDILGLISLEGPKSRNLGIGKRAGASSNHQDPNSSIQTLSTRITELITFLWQLLPQVRQQADRENIVVNRHMEDKPAPEATSILQKQQLEQLQQRIRTYESELHDKTKRLAQLSKLNHTQQSMQRNTTASTLNIQNTIQGLQFIIQNQAADQKNLQQEILILKKNSLSQKEAIDNYKQAFQRLQQENKTKTPLLYQQLTQQKACIDKYQLLLRNSQKCVNELEAQYLHFIEQYRRRIHQLQEQFQKFKDEMLLSRAQTNKQLIKWQKQTKDRIQNLAVSSCQSRLVNESAFRLQDKMLPVINERLNNVEKNNVVLKESLNNLEMEGTPPQHSLANNIHQIERLQTEMESCRLHSTRNVQTLATFQSNWDEREQIIRDYDQRVTALQELATQRDLLLLSLKTRQDNYVRLFKQAAFDLDAKAKVIEGLKTNQVHLEQILQRQQIELSHQYDHLQERNGAVAELLKQIAALAMSSKNLERQLQYNQLKATHFEEKNKRSLLNNSNSQKSD